MSTAISIQGLNKFYGNLQALKGLNLEIEQGEFFGFLGPNGAGKTTTINILTGLTKYDSGTVKVFGHDVTRNYREARSLIGLVPQEFNFDFFFNIEEILVYYAGFFGIPRNEAKQRAERLLKDFDLYGHRKKTTREISGGMKRRLLIARGIIHKPKILILDEPTAGVDVELRRDIWHYLKQLNKQGITILLTTHYIEEAERLAKRIGIIHRGRIIALDKKEKLIEQLHKINLDIALAKSIVSVPKPLKKYRATLVEDNKIRIVCDKEHDKNQILKEIRNSGLKILSAETSKSSLEDIFVELTGIGNAKRNRVFNPI